MIDYISRAFCHIKRKKLRSGLTILGITIGVMSIVLISILGDISKGTVNRELQSMGAGGVLLTANSTLQTIQLDEGSLREVRENEQVTGASPLIVSYSSLKMKDTEEDCVLWGIDSDFKKIISLELLHGRMLNQTDIKSLASVCLVDENYAKAQYARTNIVGKSIELVLNGNYCTFEIIGVVRSNSNVLQSVMGSVVPYFSYLPYTTMQVFSAQSGFRQVVLKTTTQNDDTNAMLATLSEQMDNYFQKKDAVQIDDLNSQLNMVNTVMDVFLNLLTAIAGISLLVSGLSIMTIMLVSVSERTREIGIKKSIGASRWLILIEFLIESFLVSLIGAIIGSLLAILLVTAGCAVLGISAAVSTPLVLRCVGFTLLIGVLFGAYPAFVAASLKPVDALRAE